MARQCTVKIENKTEYTLCNPHVSIVSGYCEVPPSPTLSPAESGSILFKHTSDTACGSVGVLTYDLQCGFSGKYDGKVGIMFSVPYDYNLYSNWFAAGVFAMEVQCDYNLYKEMYYATEKSFVRRKAADLNLTYRCEAVTIRATMSDCGTSVIKVEVSQEQKLSTSDLFLLRDLFSSVHC